MVVVVAIVLAPFIWLYNAVGPFWFWVIVIGLPLLALVGWFAKEAEKAKIVEQKQPPMSGFSPPIARNEDISNGYDSAWREHCEKIEQAWERGDYDWVRQALQKIAYTMVGESVTQEQKDNFTQIMKEFASADPLYKQVMDKVLPLVQANPGMKQSDIYKGQPEDIKEQMRYVLYFADELGHIIRIKKGNSYKLMPPVYVVDGEAVDSSAK